MTTVGVSGVPLREARALWPNLSFAPMAAPGEAVWRGGKLALAVNGSLDDAGVDRWPIEAPVSGRVVAERYVGPGDEMPDIVAEILCYAGQEPLDPYGEMERILAEELERRRKEQEQAAMTLALELAIIDSLKQISKKRARAAAVALLCAAASLVTLFLLDAPARGLSVIALAGFAYGVFAFRRESQAVSHLVAGFRARGDATHGVERLDLSSQRVPLLAGGGVLLMLAVALGGGVGNTQSPGAQAVLPAAGQPAQAGEAQLGRGGVDQSAPRESPRTFPLTVTDGATARSSASSGNSTVPTEAGPSFDCTGPLTDVERAICRNAPVAALDSAMAAVYTRLVGSPLNEGNWLQNTQRRWLDQRNACGTEFAMLGCLEAAYKVRIAEIEVRFGEKRPTNRVTYACSVGDSAQTITAMFFDTDPESMLLQSGSDVRFAVKDGERYVGSGVEFRSTFFAASIRWSAASLTCRLPG